jgi:hypothetical protein
MGFIGLAPSVSNWGHLGGLMAGGLCAVLLHTHRFGPWLLRWPALAAVFLVPLAGLAVLRYAIATDPAWLRVKGQAFHGQVVPGLRDELGRAWEFYEETAQPLVDRHPTRRDGRAAQDVSLQLNDWQQRLDELGRGLQGQGPEHDPHSERVRLSAREFAMSMAELYRLAERCLDAGEQWTGRQERELQEQLRRVEQLHANWLAASR